MNINKAALERLTASPALVQPVRATLGIEVVDGLVNLPFDEILKES